MSEGTILDYSRVRSPDMREIFKNVDSLFVVGQPYTLTTTTTLVVADIGKNIRVNSAGNLTITFPSSLATVNDGGKLTFIKQGAGSLTLTAGSGDYINSYSVATGSDITSTQYATIAYEYVYGMTRWVELSHEGTWASA